MLKRCEFLKSVKLLEPLSNEMITKLAGALREEDFADGACIIKQGDHGDVFYLIQVSCDPVALRYFVHRRCFDNDFATCWQRSCARI